MNDRIAWFYFGAAPRPVPAESPLILGDIAINHPGLFAADPPPAGPTDRPLPRDFPARFGRAAAAFTESVARVQKLARALDSHPDNPLNRPRLRAEYRHAVAMERHCDREDQLAALIRELTQHQPARWPEWRVEPTDACRGWATVAWGGALFTLDRFGLAVEVRPAALLVAVPAV